ncbi:MAG: hypothetical protein QNJ15_11900 [Erythrobacter sp.]|nr:hypothetical protein [Erythrobacter sp.]
MRYMIAGMLAVATVFVASPLRADSTYCSDPERERTLGRATVSLPDDNIERLRTDLRKIAKAIDMSSWSVVAKEGDGTVTSYDIGLQSPEVSVSIETYWAPNMRHADILVKRTCITDALEPWEGYWTDFLREIQASGYSLEFKSHQ